MGDDVAVGDGDGLSVGDFLGVEKALGVRDGLCGELTNCIGDGLVLQYDGGALFQQEDIVLLAFRIIITKRSLLLLVLRFFAGIVQ